MITPRRMVRCLGPGPEHEFSSTGAYNRICPRCEVRIAPLRGASVLQFVVRAGEDNTKQDTYRDE